MAQDSRLKRRQKLLNKLGGLAPTFSPAVELGAGPDSSSAETLRPAAIAPPVVKLQTPLPPIRWYSPAALALIVANLVPSAGVLFAGWNVGDLMLLQQLFHGAAIFTGFFDQSVFLKIVARGLDPVGVTGMIAP